MLFVKAEGAVQGEVSAAVMEEELARAVHRAIVGYWMDWKEKSKQTSSPGL